MGWLIRFFLFALVFYFIYKTAMAFIRGLFGEDRPQEAPRREARRPKGSNVNIDYVPGEPKDFRGGEYVDYEEVKSERKGRKG
jgi:hypothetical protein